MELDHGGSPTGCNKVATDISTDFCATVATIGWRLFVTRSINKAQTDRIMKMPSLLSAGQIL